MAVRLTDLERRTLIDIVWERDPWKAGAQRRQAARVTTGAVNRICSKGLITMRALGFERPKLIATKEGHAAAARGRGERRT